MILSEPLWSNLWEHTMLFFGGATGLGIISHMVDTFPTDGLGPRALWVLGTIKYITGHRASAAGVLVDSKELGATQKLATAKVDLKAAQKAKDNLGT